METYLRWLVGDIVKLGKNEVYLKELLIQLAVCMQTPLSLQTLAKKTSIGSHNTVSEYISILESCFALRTLYAINIDTGSYKFKSNKKFYFTDPIIYQIANDLSGIEKINIDETKIAQMLANEHLARRYNKFGYYSSKSGEIDFILPKAWAIELKWSNIPSNLSNAYKKLNIAKKIVWSHSNFLKEYP